MESLQGQLLIASPRLVDPNFYRTVVLMVQHNEEGALGLVINRPLQTTVREMWKEVNEDEDCDVPGSLHQGGPCEGPLMVLHADDVYSEIEVMKGVYFCTRRDTIERLVADNSSAMKFFVGYAGWSTGQLEAELKEGSWLSAPADPKLVFEGDDELWAALVRALSKAAVVGLVDPKLIPDDPSVN
jgi:putative transcriptional regulator